MDGPAMDSGMVPEMPRSAIISSRSHRRFVARMVDLAPEAGWNRRTVPS
jgi:hypothetical protein